MAPSTPDAYANCMTYSTYSNGHTVWFRGTGRIEMDMDVGIIITGERTRPRNFYDDDPNGL